MHDQFSQRITCRAPEAIRPSSLAVAGDSFGWGSAGLLAAVLDAISQRGNGHTRFLGLDTDTGRPVLRQHAVHNWADTSELTGDELGNLLTRHSVEAAVVVLNAELAIRLERVGCPVIYVDSIPFAWTENERIPQTLSRYCAQLCPALPRPCWPVLRGITSLHWVGRVVGARPLASTSCVPRKAVVNFGGLQSPVTTAASIDSYVRLVGIAALTALKKHGYDRIVVTGDLDPDNLPISSDLAHGLNISGGRLPRQQFLDELATAEIVATSPGQMTLLEIGALGRPAIVLPPQNLSHIMNASEVTQIVDPNIVVPWPSGTVDQDRVLKERNRGEEWAISTMYRDMVATATMWPGGIPRLAEACSNALFYAKGENITLSSLFSFTGSNGAEESVDILYDFLNSRG